jgi:hypothetical protein
MNFILYVNSFANGSQQGVMNILEISRLSPEPPLFACRYTAAEHS